MSPTKSPTPERGQIMAKIIPQATHRAMVKKLSAEVRKLGLVAASAKMKVTSVTLRSFLQGGAMYTKTMARLLRYTGRSGLAKSLEKAMAEAEAAAGKSPKKVAAKKTVAKKAVAKKAAPAKKKAAAAPAKKKAAPAKKKPRLVSKGSGKNPKKTLKMKRVRRGKAPVHILAGGRHDPVLVGKDFDDIEEEIEEETLSDEVAE